MLRKFQKKSRNYFTSEDTRRNKDAPEGPHQEGGALLAWPGGLPPGRLEPWATTTPGALGHPLTSPLAYKCPSSRKPLRQTSFSKTYCYSATVAIPISGRDHCPCSGTLSEGEDHPGGSFVTMTASRIMRE